MEIGHILATVSDQSGKQSATSMAKMVLDKDWLLGQARVRCCQPSMPDGRVCARMLASVCDYDAVLSVLTLKDFNLWVLKDCLACPTDTDGSNGARVLATAARHVLFQHIHEVVADLPTNVISNSSALYRPVCWTSSSIGKNIFNLIIYYATSFWYLHNF